MKNILAIILCMTIAFSLSACADKKDMPSLNAADEVGEVNPDVSDTSKDDEDVNTTTDTGEDESIVTDTSEDDDIVTDAIDEENITTESSEDEASDSMSFDTSWTDNEFEMLLPEIPFDGWTVKEQTETVYEIEVLGLNTSAATNPPDSGEPDGADKDTLINYLSTLPTYGFSIEEIGQDYNWLVTDKNGNEIEFKIGDGGCWITITAAEENSSNEDNSSSNVETDQDENDNDDVLTDARWSLVPEFPDAEWEVIDIDENMSVKNAYGVDRAFVDECLNAFRNTEYTLVYETEQGNYQYWEYESAECSIIVMFNSAEGYCGLEIHWW